MGGVRKIEDGFTDEGRQSSPSHDGSVERTLIEGRVVDDDQAEQVQVPEEAGDVENLRNVIMLFTKVFVILH